MLGGMKTTYKITEETPVSLSSLSSSMVSSIEAERAATVTEAVEFTVEVSVSLSLIHIYGDAFFRLRRAVDFVPSP